ncbi:hypothetical protein [Ktedonospora formicarum]|nr:hypothetical protein [Ktedonospora formicarum]
MRKPSQDIPRSDCEKGLLNRLLQSFWGACSHPAEKCFEFGGGLPWAHSAHPRARPRGNQTDLSFSGEALADMGASWSEAAPEEWHDIVGGLLMVGGLVYNLERQVIVGLIPRPSVLPVLALGLQQTEKWEQREERH